MARTNGRPPGGAPQVPIFEIEEHTYTDFGVEIDDPMPGVRQVTFQIVDAANRRIIKHHLPFDVSKAEELGKRLTAPHVEPVVGIDGLDSRPS
jgi:hypothetical protein